MTRPKGANGGGLSREQWRNAVIIYQVGVQMGMSPRDIQIALMAAMVESGLRNLNYGDSDSLGLFQQRPSQGWGSPEQILNPQYAARKFFQSLKSLGQKRYQMTMGDAAQAVQRSAYPDRYQQQLSFVRNIWPNVTNLAGNQPMDMSGQPYFQVKDPGPTPNIMAGFDARPPDPKPPETPMLGPAVSSALDAPSFNMLGEAQPRRAKNPGYTMLGPGTNAILPDIIGGFHKGMNGWRSAAVQEAMKFIGTPYMWGGEDPKTGFDCSGLVQYVYGKLGYDLPRVSYDQATYGKRVPIARLRPGDLVAWDNNPRIAGADHIAIYIGHGKIIEAPAPGLSVRVRKLGSDEGAIGVKLNF